MQVPGADGLDPTIAQPRMLKIDRSGKIWVNTGSGHLISLDPNTNRMTKHQIPGLGTNDSSTNDPWGVAPDAQHFLVETVQSGAVIVTVTNWFDELRRRAPMKK